MSNEAKRSRTGIVKPSAEGRLSNFAASEGKEPDVSHLWVQDGSESEWAVLPLDESAPMALDSMPPRRLAAGIDGRDAGAVLVPGPRGLWALLTANGRDVRVNGMAIPTGLRVIADRDELRVGSRTLYFSSERPPRIEPFNAAGAAHPTCPRCCAAIASETVCVRCGACGVASHQSCWLYCDSCPTCGAPTALDAGPRWTPAEL